MVFNRYMRQIAMYRDIRVQSIAYNDSMDPVEKIRQEDFYYVDKTRLIEQ